MITSQDKELISRLIKKYAGKASTEAMIAFVADTNGMLAACKLLVTSNNSDDQVTMSWVDEQCYKCKADVRGFLYEVNQVLSIFQPGQGSDANYDILGLKVGAGQEEIKQAYRKLSRRYHPDTNTSPNADDDNLFVQITKAYHALINKEREEPATSRPQVPVGNWRQDRKSTISSERKKKNFFWFAVLAVVMIVVSIIAANGYRKRAMLAGLQNNRVAFIPPEPVVAKEDVSLKETSVIKIEPVEEDDPNSFDMVPPERPQNEISTTRKSVGAGVSEIPSLVSNVAPEQVNEQERAKEESEQQIQKLQEKIAQLESENSSLAQSVKAKQSIPQFKPPVIVEDTQQPSSPKNKPVKESTNQTAPKEQKTQSTQITSVQRVEKVDHKKKQFSKKTKEYPESSIAPAVQPSLVAQKTKAKKAAPLSQEKVQANIQARIEDFLKSYTKAYEHKDLLAFSSFFELQATENGQLLGEVLPTYADLFQKSATISLDISVLKWEQKEKDIFLDGRFSIDITYKNSNKIHGTGEISFLLADLQPQLSIKELRYHFDKQ